MVVCEISPHTLRLREYPQRIATHGVAHEGIACHRLPLERHHHDPLWVERPLPPDIRGRVCRLGDPRPSVGIQ